MSDKVVEHMIDFVEAKERDFQASRLSDTKKATDIVKNILDELEKTYADENTKD